MTFPNLFIPGAAKAGTTSLADYLSQHPDIFMSPTKEPHYFSRLRPAPHLAAFFRHVDDERTYLELFRQARDERWIGEASTSYFWEPEAPRRIDEASPAARFVIVLRDPVGRAYSHYLNDVREGVERRSFRQAIEEELATPATERGWGVGSLYVDCSFYSRRLQSFLDRFGTRVLVQVFEELVADPVGGLREIFSFLQIDAGFAERVRLEVHNPYARPRGAAAARLLGSGAARRLARRLLPRALRRGARRALLQSGPKPELDAATERLLIDLYADDAAGCETLLGRDLPWLEKRPRGAKDPVGRPA